MNHSNRYFYRLAFALVLAIPCHANVIDFADYPEGTVASAPNPYQGVLNIQAQAGAQRYDSSWYWKEGFVLHDLFWDGYAGVLAVDPSKGLVDQCGYLAYLTATFLVPVTAVSFTAYTIRCGGYGFDAVDANGQVVRGGGIFPGVMEGGLLPPATGWTTFHLDAPDGGYVTTFDIGNSDLNAGGASFWVKDISFTVLPQVADGGCTATLFLLAGSACLGLSTLRRHKLV